MGRVDTQIVRGVIVHKVHGEIGLPEILEAFAHGMHRHGFQRDMPALWDMEHGSVMALSTQQIQTLVQSLMQEGNERGNRVKVAIYAVDDLNYGLGRMYAQYADVLPHETRIFRDYPEAIAWLNQN